MEEVIKVREQREPCDGFGLGPPLIEGLRCCTVDHPGRAKEGAALRYGPVLTNSTTDPVGSTAPGQVLRCAPVVRALVSAGLDGRHYGHGLVVGLGAPTALRTVSVTGPGFSFTIATAREAPAHRLAGMRAVFAATAGHSEHGQRSTPRLASGDGVGLGAFVGSRGRASQDRTTAGKRAISRGGVCTRGSWALEGGSELVRISMLRGLAAEAEEDGGTSGWGAVVLCLQVVGELEVILRCALLAVHRPIPCLERCQRRPSRQGSVPDLREGLAVFIFKGALMSSSGPDPLREDLTAR